MSAAVRFTCYMSAEEKAQLYGLASTLERSPAWVIRMLLKHFSGALLQREVRARPAES